MSPANSFALDVVTVAAASALEETPTAEATNTAALNTFLDFVFPFALPNSETATQHCNAAFQITLYILFIIIYLVLKNILEDFLSKKIQVYCTPK